MRTTIELSDAHRARLLELAARRREKGFSSLIAEAVAEYLTRHDDLVGARQRALAARGRLTADDAAAMEAASAELRAHWR